VREGKIILRPCLTSPLKVHGSSESKLCYDGIDKDDSDEQIDIVQKRLLRLVMPFMRSILVADGAGAFSEVSGGRALITAATIIFA